MILSPAEQMARLDTAAGEDRVFEISTSAGLKRVKLRADRNSDGAVKWLELLAVRGSS